MNIGPQKDYAAQLENIEFVRERLKRMFTDSGMDQTFTALQVSFLVNTIDELSELLRKYREKYGDIRCDQPR